MDPNSNVETTTPTVEQNPVTQPTEPIIPPPVIPDLPKPKNKLLLILLIVLLVILMGVGGLFIYKSYFSKPTTQPINNSTTQPVSTPDPTIDWQTYTNDKLGFSFKYPQGYTISALTDGSINLQKDSTRALLYLNVQDNPNNLSPRDFLQNELTEDPSIKTVFDNNIFSDIQIGSISALKLVKKESASGYQDFSVSISYNNKLYSLNFGPKNSEIEIVNQVLSTFKLVSVLDDLSEVTKTVTVYLKNKGYDLNKIIINKPQKLGSLTNVYSVGWTEAGFVGDSQYVLIGKKDNVWIIPKDSDSTYCEWIKTSNLDEATQAYMGSGCNSN